MRADLVGGRLDGALPACVFTLPFLLGKLLRAVASDADCGGRARCPRRFVLLKRWLLEQAAPPGLGTYYLIF